MNTAEVLQPTLYFTYTYNCGGLADLIKGAATCWYIADHYGFKFDIRFIHELGLIFPHLFMKNKFQQINLIDTPISTKIREFMNNPSNRQSSYCVYINGCLDFPKNPLDSRKPFLKTVQPFLKTFYKERLPLPSPGQSYTYALSNPFQVVHCRMGDLYLGEATNRCDNRIGNRARYETKLNILLSNLPTKPTLICSDSTETQTELVNKLPGSFTLTTDQYHFAYNTKKKTNQQIIESIGHTLQEHSAMTRADSIYMFCYSGYPIIAACIGNIPLYEVTDTGIVPYISEWNSSATE